MVIVVQPIVVEHSAFYHLREVVHQKVVDIRIGKLRVASVLDHRSFPRLGTHPDLHVRVAGALRKQRPIRALETLSLHDANAQNRFRARVLVDHHVLPLDQLFRQAIRHHELRGQDGIDGGADGVPDRRKFGGSSEAGKGEIDVGGVEQVHFDLRGDRQLADHRAHLYDDLPTGLQLVDPEAEGADRCGHIDASFHLDVQCDPQARGLRKRVVDVHAEDARTYAAEGEPVYLHVTLDPIGQVIPDLRISLLADLQDERRREVRPEPVQGFVQPRWQITLLLPRD
mmetsp:Transcript_21125/g.72722  ORF Transcript_21125/g.72722 Transcript_21125/m.72722 type:complete len:284 (-) Transcript_21125:1082-1933(-)